MSDVQIFAAGVGMGAILTMLVIVVLVQAFGDDA